MENVLLIVHLLLALALIGVVLMQRSEGGALGIGGGGGGGGLMSGRSATTALAKVTWGLAIAFLITSMSLTILATSSTTSSAVLGTGPLLEEGADGELTPVLPPALGDDLLPPGDPNAPALPPAAD